MAFSIQYSNIFRLSQLLMCALIFTFVSSKDASSWDVRPMIIDLGPAGSQTQKTITVNNTNNETLSLELAASSIEQIDGGVEQLSPAEDDFLIFPPTAAIKPGQSQTVRIQYIGEPGIEVSKSYRISVKQIPIKFGEEGRSGIEIVFNFDILANVVPSDAEPEPIVRSIFKSNDENHAWHVKVENLGSRYLRFLKTEWNIQNQNGEKFTVAGHEIRSKTNGTILLPGTVQTLKMSRPDGFLGEPTSIDVKVVD